MRRLILLFLLLSILIPLNVQAQEGETSSAPQVGIADFPDNVPLPIRVGVALIVNDIDSVSEAGNTFTADIELRVRWHDPRQAFDAQKVGVDRLELTAEAAADRMMWTPGVAIANMVDEPIREEGGMFIFSDGTLTQVRRVTATFETDFNMNAFPFDRQQLEVRLALSDYSSSRVTLVHEQVDINISGIRQSADLPNWHVEDLHFETGSFRGWNGNVFSQMQVYISTMRDPGSYIPLIFVPMLLILFSSLLVVWADEIELGDRVNLVTGGILALIALNFTIVLSYPALGPDSNIQQLFSIGFIYLMGMFVVAITLYNEQVSTVIASSYFVTELKYGLRWFMPLILFLVIGRAFLLILM